MGRYQIVPPATVATTGVRTLVREPTLEAVARIPSLTGYWSPRLPVHVAGDNAVAFRFRSMMGGNPARALHVNRPNLGTINGNLALSFGDGLPALGRVDGGLLEPSNTLNGAIVADGLQLGASYSLGFGGLWKAGGSGNLMGTAGAGTDAFYVNVSGTNGFLSAAQRSSSGYVVRSQKDWRGIPVVVVVSYDAETQRMTLEINGQIEAEATVAYGILNGQLRWGGIGTVNTGAVAKGLVGEVGTFAASLHRPEREDQLAALRTRLLSLYIP